MTQNLTTRIQKVMTAILIVVCATTLSRTSIASGSTTAGRNAKHEMDVKIDASGDATFSETLSLPTQSYLELKDKFNNPVLLFRSVQNALSWSQVEGLQASFDDANFSVKASYTHRGYVRVNRAGEWTLKFPTDSEPDMLTSNTNVAIFVQAIDSNFGAMSQTMRIQMPEGSSKIQYNKDQNELTYDFTPAPGDSNKTEVEFELDSKPHLMSCLATLYGDESFSNFWAARSVFQNTGDQPISNYRIRFRVAGHSGWSQWNRSKVVYPGQTVVDPFFPVFDLDTLADMSTTRPAMIEVEYEYESVDGAKTQETDAVRVQMLSRNQVVYSSREQDEVVNWSEAFEYGPYIIAAFAHSDDPAIQQLAGRISGMANGAAASASDADAEAFMAAMWRFMEINKISYQTPPSLTMNNTFGQNVKYGRDVLRNRAGTCIDLAILWASTAKAVGLKSYVMLIRGHAYPVIGLPGGNVAPIEATMIGRGTFFQAWEKGVETYNESLRGDHYLIDIDQLQDLGVRSLDLAKIDDNFLGELGYQFDEGSTGTQVETSGRAEYTNTNYQGNSGQLDTQSLIGTWGVRYEEQGTTRYMQFSFNANGQYEFAHFEARNGEWVKFDTGNGTWGVQGSSIVIQNPRGRFEFPARIADGKLVINTNGSEAVFDKTN